MGYTPTGGPKGLGQFNTTPQTVADLNKLRDLIALMGNFRGALTEAQRDAITGDALFEGLMILNADTGTLEVSDGSGWVPIPPGPYAMAKGEYTVSALAGAGGNSTANITFPAGRFTVAPHVSVQPGSARYGASPLNVTPNGCQIFTQNFSPASPGATTTATWTAIQMLPNAAAG